MISISNLAWCLEDEKKIFNYLNLLNINQIELSLTKKFGSWDEVSRNKLLNYKKEIFEEYGLKISSLQSIFFNKPFSLFHDNEEFTEHFKKVIDFSDALDCRYIVFGSPKNRKKLNLEKKHCDDIFIKTFETLSNYNPKILIGKEPNPRYYNCDYLYNFQQVSEIVFYMNKQNIKCHLDFGCVSLEGDDYVQIFFNNKKDLELIHVSVKDLKHIHEDDKIRKFFIDNSHEDKIFSIEMINQSFHDIIKSIKILKRENK